MQVGFFFIIMSSVKNIIFDFDGTLGDTILPSLNSLRIALNETETKYDASKLNADLMVMSPDEIRDTLKISGDIRTILKRFMQIRMKTFEGTVLYPGIYELLFNLKQDNKKLFIATNNFSPIVEMTLKELRINIFDDIRTSDYNGGQMSKNQMVIDLVKKYGLNQDNAVMVGDGYNDIIAGKQANIKTIAVDWGYDSDKTALKNSADFYVKTVRELSEILTG